MNLLFTTIGAVAVLFPGNRGTEAANNDTY
jgi:hypothetical protein